MASSSTMRAARKAARDAALAVQQELARRARAITEDLAHSSHRGSAPRRWMTGIREKVVREMIRAASNLAGDDQPSSPPSPSA